MAGAGTPIATLYAAMELDTSGVDNRISATIEKLKRGGLEMAAGFKPADLAMADAARSTGQLAAGAERLRNQLDPLRAATIRYAQSINEIVAMHSAEKISAQEKAQFLAHVEQLYDQETAAIRQNTQATNQNSAAQANNAASNGMARAGLQQLAMNLSDMTTMWSLGAKGSQIFGSQIGQVIQSVQLLTGGTGRFAAFMANPWVMAITYGTMILGPLAGALLDTEDATKKAEFASYGLSDAQQILGSVVDLTTGKLKTQSDALIALAQAQAIAGRVQAQARQAEARSKLNDVATPSLHITGGMGGGLNISRGRRAEGDVASALLDGTLSFRESIAGLESLRKTGYLTDKQFLDLAQDFSAFGVEAENIKVFEQLDKALHGDTEAMGVFLKTTKERKTHGDRHAETIAREAEAIDAQISGLWKLVDAYKASDEAALKAEITAKATEQGIKKRADVEEYVAQQIRLSVAQRAADAAKDVAELKAENDAREKYNAQVAAGTITAEQAAQQMRDEAQLRPLLAAEALAEGDAKLKLAAIIAALTNEQARANEEARKERDNAGAMQQGLRLVQIQAETRLEAKLGAARIAALKGLHGDALEDELARINHEREIGAIRIQAEAEAEAARKQGLIETAAKILEVADAQVKLSDQAFDIEKAVTDNERWNRELERTEQLFKSIGGAAGVLGGILEGMRTGDFSGVGGSFGALLNVVMNKKFTDKGADGKDTTTTLLDKLNEIFSKSGTFGKTLKDVLETAGIGISSARAVFGDKGTAQDIGAGIGAVAGKALGSAIAGPVGGMIGSIAGGILGGFVGGLFAGPPPSGTATIRNGQVTTSGNDDERKDQANQMASSVSSGLAQIADQLGATVGNYLVSIGVYKDQYRVNYSGAAIHGDRDGANGDRETFDSAEAAIAAAIKNAIADGALEGARAGVKVLLTKEGDIEAQLRKALKFQAVFDELEAATSPFNAQLNDLKDQMTDLTKIFAEAGASAAELGQLQEWLVMKQQQLIDQASSTYRANFYTDAENVAYAKKQIADKLGPLGYGNVDTIAEYKALVAATDPLAKPELYGALMDVADAFGTLKQAEENAADAAEEAAAKTKALAQQRTSMEIQLLQLQGQEAAALAKQRAMELEALDPSLRDLQKDIYKAQDLAKAKEALSAAYDRESSALENTIDTMGRAGDKLRDYRESLNASAGASAVSVMAAFAKLDTIGTAARNGDATAMGDLPDAGDAYINAVKARAGNAMEVAAAVALVKRTTEAAIGAADHGVTVAEQQLEQLKASVAGQIDIAEKVETVREVLDRIAAMQANSSTAAIAQDPPRNAVDDTEREARKDRRQRRLEDLLSRGHERQDRATEILTQVNKLLTRLEEDGSLRVKEIT